ncbi:hypothetical protein LSG31_19450 [Fodinisporobacter ferrooxydans]|uniref:Tetratricopeptide repeat protein n=1 Tax=Fodinisporobacter ferrooxydans TaxID=2901836 RepID=A0ABY4CKM6_9BACL|nr:hypothetical protein LSG31_19450 [Alicyclobacillaceae bacterium MYW30-H2]
MRPENGKIESTFQTIANKFTIADLNGDKLLEIAAWIKETGPLFKYQIYHWDTSAQQFKIDSNDRYPRFFKQSVIPYYESLLQNGQPPYRMVAYGLSYAYVYAGEYKQALPMIEKGLAMKNQYPPDKELLQLKSMAQQALQK